MTTDTSSERRPDRRVTHPLLTDWRYAFRGRRRQVRRDADDGFVQVDHVRKRVVLVVSIVLVLSAMDAYFTLKLMDAGVVTEANPFMRFFINVDEQMFVNIKTALTGGALVFLTACSRLRVFRGVPVTGILYGVMGLYGLLIAYHLTLLVQAGLI